MPNFAALRTRCVLRSTAPALADGYAETQATLHLRGTRDKESIQLGKRICPPAAAVVVGGRARVEGCIFEACGGRADSLA